MPFNSLAGNKASYVQSVVQMSAPNQSVIDTHLSPSPASTPLLLTLRYVHTKESAWEKYMSAPSVGRRLFLAKRMFAEIMQAKL